MRPQLHLFFLPISTLLLLLHPATSLCVPRNTSFHTVQPLAPTAAPSIKSPAPTPATKPPSPSPSPSPHPQSLPPEAPVLPSGNDSSMSAGDDSQSATGSGETATAKSICGQTSFPAICLSSVEILLPTVTGPIDTKTMLILQAKALKLRSTSSQALATKLATHPNTDKSYASSYQSAADFLGQAIDNIDQGLDAVTTDDMDTAHSMFDAICTNYSDVENEFMDWDEPSALDADLNDFDHMSANILDLLHGLK